MKKCSILLFLFFLVFGISGIASANLYLQPEPVDIFDLEHDHYYTWSIETSDITDVTDNWSGGIVGVNLIFESIYNWTYYGNEIDPSKLFVWLLNDVALGVDSNVIEYYDPHPYGETYDNIPDLINGAVTGTHLVTYETPDNDPNLPDIPYNDPTTIEYSFDSGQLSSFITYLSDGNTVGIGIDPDCHYFNEGITLEIVPEPATMFLLGSGLIGLVGLGRKRFLKK